VLHPRHHPFILLANTISESNGDGAYCSKLVDLLLVSTIDEVMKDNEVKKRADISYEKDIAYIDHLKQNTTVTTNVSITDFRPLMPPPRGGRFLVYSLFPETASNARIRYNKDEPDKVVISLGSNIFSKSCKVHLGRLVAKYGGGGHEGAGSCSCHKDEAEKIISEIIAVLDENTLIL